MKQKQKHTQAQTRSCIYTSNSTRTSQQRFVISTDYGGHLILIGIILLSSSSSYRAGSTDIPDPLSPLLPIVHRPR